jgi:hypothetical protein
MIFGAIRASPPANGLQGFDLFCVSVLLLLLLVCEAIGTAATPGLLCQARVIVKMIVVKQMACRLAREI